MLMGLKGGAILFSEMTPPPDAEDVFNRWYDTQHTPSHVEGVPGFISAQRYRSDAGPHYLAVYEMVSAEVLESKEYLSRKFMPDSETRAMLASVTGFTRYVGEEISFHRRHDIPGDPLDADVIIAVFYAVPPERWSEFLGWHETEHTPMLLECEDWWLTRHIAVIDSNPEPYTHMILHYVRDVTVLRSPELEMAENTEWRGRLAAEGWFQPHRVAYRKHGSRFRKSG